MFAQTKIHKLHVDDFQTKQMLGGHFFYVKRSLILLCFLPLPLDQVKLST